MKPSRITLMSSGLLLVLLIQSCVTPRRPQIVDGPSLTDAQGHWVQGARIQAIMKELQSLTVATWPQELEPEFSNARTQQRVEVFSEAKHLAEGLARAADEIPAAVTDVEMSEADKRSFMAQVDTLREQAQRLGKAAGSTDERGMDRALKAIDETCMSCHERFRDFSGSINRS